MKRTLFVVAAIATLSASFASSEAAVTKFAVDPNLSFLTITPNTSLFGVVPLPSSQQGLGSFTTSYSGLLVADINPGTIQLLSPSRIVAGNSGNWLPGTDYSSYQADPNNAAPYLLSAEPANYGIVTDLTALGSQVIGVQGQSPTAIRDLKIRLSDLAPKPLIGGIFDEATTVTDIYSGTAYYSSGSPTPSPTTDLSDLLPTITEVTAGSASLTSPGGVPTLTIPVSFTVSYPLAVLILTTQYTGTIVATAVPEPSTLALLGSLGATLLLKRRR